MTQPPNKRTSQICYLFFNFLSTIAVTFFSKACFSKVSFGFPAALCNVHFCFTLLGVEILRRFGWFEPIKVVRNHHHHYQQQRQKQHHQLHQKQQQQKHQQERIMLSSPTPYGDINFAVICLVVGLVTPLSNTSLKLNSMGFYQIFKLLVTPVVVVLEYWLDGKQLSVKRATALVAVCTFVFISSRADLAFSWRGTVCATIWVPLAATYKVQWGRVLKRFGKDCSTLALMYSVLPYSIVVQACISPLVDPPGLLQYRWTTEAFFWIGSSGIAAFLVNLSGFLVMGHLGALAHVLLGQLKTCVIMLGSYFLFESQYSLLQLVGAFGAVLSIVAYTYTTVHEKEIREDKVPNLEDVVTLKRVVGENENNNKMLPS